MYGLSCETKRPMSGIGHGCRATRSDVMSFLKGEQYRPCEGLLDDNMADGKLDS